MKIISVELPENHKLAFVGDTHEGTLLCNKTGIKKAIDYIRSDPLIWVCFMGDAIEAIVPIDDPRYDPSTIDSKIPVPLLQANQVINDFNPIKDKLLVWLLGNHEYKIRRFGNLAEYIADELDCPYGTYTCKMVVKNSESGEVMYRVFLWHGAGSVRSKLSDPMERLHTKRRSLKRKLFLKEGDCDLMAMGHTHQLIHVHPQDELFLYGDSFHKQGYTEAFTNDKNWIPPDRRWYINTGGFFKAYEDGISSYVEMTDCDPIELGFMTATVECGKITSVKPIII